MPEKDEKIENKKVLTEEPLALDIEEKKQEEFPTVPPGTEKPTYNVEEMPKVDNPPQRTEPTTSRRSTLKYWLIGLGIATGLALAGDAYLQKPKITVDYKPAKGFKHVYDQNKQKGVDLYNKGLTELKEVNKQYIKLEERVTKVKELGKYDEYPTAYKFGAGMATGALGVYLLMRRRRRT